MSTRPARSSGLPWRGCAGHLDIKTEPGGERADQQGPRVQGAAPLSAERPGNPDPDAVAPEVVGAAPEVSAELVEQDLGVLEIGSVEALGEPAVDRGEEVMRLPSLASLRPQAS